MLYILEHMYQRSKTAFKHPACGGVIFSYVWPERTRFKCERCGEWADDLLNMALGQVAERLHPLVANDAVDTDEPSNDELTADEKPLQNTESA